MPQYPKKVRFGFLAKIWPNPNRTLNFKKDRTRTEPPKKSVRFGNTEPEPNVRSSSDNYTAMFAFVSHTGLFYFSFIFTTYLLPHYISCTAHLWHPMIILLIGKCATTKKDSTIGTLKLVIYSVKNQR